MRFPRLGRLMAVGTVALVVVVACEDETTAGVPVPRAVAATGGDGQSGAIGTTLSSPLEVTVTGSDGRPLSGTAVQFVVSSRTGSVNPASTTTGGDGKASTTLTLGSIAERVAVQARVGVLTAEFSATALAAAPATPTVLAGDLQVGVPSGALPALIEIEVRDGEGNPVKGAELTWTPSGGGSVESVGADALGVARSRWTLGPALGAQTLTVSGGGADVTLTAAAGVPCTDAAAPAPQPHAIGDTENGALGDGNDCVVAGEGLADRYELTAAAQTAATFTMTSTELDAKEKLTSAAGDAYAVDDNSAGGTDARFKVILAAATYRVNASAAQPVAVAGAYSLTSATTSEDAAACERVWLTPGVLTAQSLNGNECLDPKYGAESDEFHVFLREGETITVTMLGPLDTYLALFSEAGFANGETVEEDDDGGPGANSLLTYTVPAGGTGVYIIDCGTFSGVDQGPYTVEVQIN